MKTVLTLFLLCSLHTFALDYKVEVVADHLTHPWGWVELPNGDMLVSERGGRLWRISPDWARAEVTGLPRITRGGQGGLLDLALHPDFANTGWLYFSFSQPGPGGASTAVARAKLVEDHLIGRKLLFVQQPKLSGGSHFGSRLVFDKDGFLFITTGERFHARNRAQQLDNHLGKILRLHDDGRVPEDNPFVKQQGALPEIWSYGHRNIQGAAIHPQSGILWINEHGPRGGDEVNLIKKGANYGWPLVTFGEEYSGGKIGLGSRMAGMEDALWVWVPSIAPSGMLFYTGELFPQWRGQLFIGALASRKLVRLTLDGETIVQENHLLTELGARIRTVGQGHDGAIYVLTDEEQGQLLRLVPAQ